jgi:hypothetical protein
MVSPRTQREMRSKIDGCGRSDTVLFAGAAVRAISVKVFLGRPSLWRGADNTVQISLAEVSATQFRVSDPHL